MPRSRSGGRNELGQNFLTHEPTLVHLTDLVARTTGPILEIGAPVPSVDGGIRRVVRRQARLVPARDRHSYERFVRAIFTGRGSGLAQIVQRATRLTSADVRRALVSARVGREGMPRDLTPEQWLRLWIITRGKAPR